MLYLWVQRDGGDFNQAERQLMVDAHQILCARLSLKTPRNKLESLGYLFLCFILFLRSRTFPLNMFQSFLQETFRMATKTNF